MLYTKFRGNRSTGSREIFLRVSTIDRQCGYLGQVTNISMTLTLNANITSCSQLAVSIYNFQITGCIVSEKSIVFLQKRIIRPCYTIGHGQTRVIICINFEELVSLVLHAKFQDHRTCFKFLAYCFYILLTR